MAKLTERAAMEIFCNKDGGITIIQKCYNDSDAVITFDRHDAPIIIEMIQTACDEAKELENESNER